MKAAYAVLGLILCLGMVYVIGCEDDDTVGPVGPDTTVASLKSKTWHLVSYGTPGAETPVLSGTSVSATFGDGTVSGNSGCNTYSANYNADDMGNLSVGSFSSTMMLCSPPERMTQENAFRNAMQNATAFRIQGGVLEILYGSGKHILLE